MTNTVLQKELFRQVLWQWAGAEPPDHLLVQTPTNAVNTTVKTAILPSIPSGTWKSSTDPALLAIRKFMHKGAYFFLKQKKKND